MDDGGIREKFSTIFDDFNHRNAKIVRIGDRQRSTKESIFRVNETTIDDQYWVEYAIHVYFEESTPCLNLVTKNFSKDRYLSLIKSVALLSPLNRIYVAEWKIFETFGRRCNVCVINS